MMPNFEMMIYKPDAPRDLTILTVYVSEPNAYAASRSSDCPSTIS